MCYEFVTDSRLSITFLRALTERFESNTNFNEDIAQKTGARTL